LCGKEGASGHDERNSGLWVRKNPKTLFLRQIGDPLSVRSKAPLAAGLRARLLSPQQQLPAFTAIP
jgi:hypothetical protein